MDGFLEIAGWGVVCLLADVRTDGGLVPNFINILLSAAVGSCLNVQLIIAGQFRRINIITGSITITRQIARKSIIHMRRRIVGFRFSHRLVKIRLITHLY